MKTIKSSDNNGFVTLKGVFEDAREDINKELAALPKGVTKTKKIGYRLFGDIMRAYFKIMFEELLLGRSFSMLNKFGTLRVVKTLCIRYNPFTYKVYTDENGKKRVKKVKFDINKYGGYWHFIFWDVGKKWRQYEFEPSIKWKRKYMKAVDNGKEYIDMSLLDTGAHGSLTYIHKVR